MELVGSPGAKSVNGGLIDRRVLVVVLFALHFLNNLAAEGAVPGPDSLPSFDIAAQCIRVLQPLLMAAIIMLNSPLTW